MSKVIAIIGGGIAGTTVAETLRARDAEATIMIFEEEPHPVYSRVLLPHYVKGKVPRERVFLKKMEWYAEKGIAFFPGTTVTAIDHAKRELIAGGKTFSYTELVLATGTRARRLFENVEGVHHLAKLEDADRLREALLHREPSDTAIVYGGGFIACEFVTIFAQFGLSTTLLLRGKGFWNTILSTELQEVLRKFLEERGVEVKTETSIAACERADGNIQVTLGDGSRLVATLVGVGVGSPARTELAMSLGLKNEGGIEADAYLRTALTGVYTAGDATEVAMPQIGTTLRSANWQAALMEGRTLGATLGGEETVFAQVTSYSTHLLDLPIVFVGDVRRVQAEKAIVRRAESGVGEEHFVRGGKLVGAVLMGDVTRRAEITRVIGQAYGS